jgi:hypothetical protein
MRCCPGVIFNVIGEMSEALKGRIQDLGFGELLHLKIDSSMTEHFVFSTQLCCR